MLDWKGWSYFSRKSMVRVLAILYRLHVIMKENLERISSFESLMENATSFWSKEN